MLRERQWQAAVANAASGSAETMLQKVTATWATARQEYLLLWDAESPSVPLLREAARRLEELEKKRLELVRQMRRAV
jgi:hypothetical protein